MTIYDDFPTIEAMARSLRKLDALPTDKYLVDAARILINDGFEARDIRRYADCAIAIESDRRERIAASIRKVA